MHRFLLTLGRAQSIALAESLHLLSWRTPAQLAGWASQVAILDADGEPDLVALARAAGGIIKAHRGLGVAPLDPDAIVNLAALEPFFPEKFEGPGKFTFGVSLEGFDWPINDKLSFFRAVATGLKDQLKERGIAPRFIGYDPKERNLSLTSVHVGENHLLDRGFELVIAKHGEECVLGHTVAVQDYEAYGHRDYERPERLTRSGLLPPKLARIMVNLARQPGVDTIYDPFCGGGGVLMEALDLGLNAVGTDVDPQAVEACQKNLSWFQSTGHAKGLEWSARTADARRLTDVVEPLTAEAVASETYLGPPLTHALQRNQAETLRLELRPLYVESLSEIRIACKPGARVVMALPRIASRDGELSFSIKRETELMGYTRPAVLPEHLDEPLIYRRQGQKVARELLVLQA